MPTKRIRLYLRCFKKLLATSSLIGCVVLGMAQSHQPAQFFASPLQLNPALTGKFDGSYRISSTLPSIGGSFIASSLSLELPVPIASSSTADSWGIGVRGMTGRTTNGILASTEFSIATAYNKGLDEEGNHQIGLGFQATRHNNNVHSDLTLDADELNSLSELPLSIPTELMRTDEILRMNYPAYTDLSAGFLYSGSTNGSNNFYIGASGYHLNSPCESYSGKNYFGLEPRYNLHAGGAIPQGEGSRMVYFSTLFSKQADLKTVSAGGAIGRILNSSSSESARMLYIGAWARYNTLYNSLMPYLGIENNGFQLGVSYEMVFSKSETAQVKRGGLEVTLIYLRRPKGYQPSPSPRF